MPKPTLQRKLLLGFSLLVFLYYLLIKKDVPDVLKKAASAAGLRGDKSLPRGLRNNNPLNLRKGVKWAGRDGDDGAFDIFLSMEYGIKAALQNFKTQYKRGYNTVTKLVGRWAPPSENNTKAYIASVCKSANITANEVINLSDTETLARIVYAMAQHENGPDITKAKLPFATVLGVVQGAN